METNLQTEIGKCMAEVEEFLGKNACAMKSTLHSEERT
jgi:hypothetical protein